ncbi:aromatase/cyclase [Roseospira visakhapatnamensis]|uniref:Aromatase n=1 Tax=Roseospira visakhapatnamensis TaxID=390880 RepID=A0A7W6RDT8_9PROT|nr:SRPBCC family protein [Roseospira visakhapatnamensis]MBB4266505.1 aromatase [Roseospira visakhapatnamensis]
MKTDHSIEVACPADPAFRVGLEVAHWPEIFPPCLAAKVLEETEDRQKIALTARANDTIFSWESERAIDRERRQISFSQSKPSPLVRFMNGTWRFEPKDAGCVITLTHDFEVADRVSGVVDGVSTREDAAKFMLDSIETNSRKELSAVAERLERERWRHVFEESLVIRQPIALISRLLRDAASWPWLLPHCTDVQVIYDDGRYQEFVMVVQVGDVEERIRSVRVLAPDRIEYFQPAPPPALREHRGRWTLTEGPDGVEVVSWHDVVLNPAFWADKKEREAAKQHVEAAINRNSLGTMQAIVAKLEGSNHA